MDMARTLSLGLALLALAGPALAGSATNAVQRGDTEFYEKKIRPLLAEHCYACHGAKQHASGLRLDSPRALLQGGARGPAIVPGDPDHSLLVRAVRYGDESPRMPPKGKLSTELIADLTTWIRMGAPAADPTASPPGSVATPGKSFVLAERKRHWAYQPIKPVVLPQVKNSHWVQSPIDRFVLAKLEAAGLSPAPPADRRTLLRRATFDLIGLPPTPAEVTAFLADRSPDAYAKVVDRLLASPHYGERWARHWLDLVRFAETLGHELDFELFNAYRYRDYVIRAFNADVPYDRFVIEQIAGDLLPHPRRHPTEGFNESTIGTAFFWLGEAKHSPVDVRQEQADRIDNQIDVFGKTFLAQTVACARCHDHKFDAISQKDYYALAGYLKSSRYQQVILDAPERMAAKTRGLAALRAQLRPAAVAAVTETWTRQSGRIARSLLATRSLVGDPQGSAATVEEVARAADLEPALLERWVTALREKAVSVPDHPLCAWAQLSGDAAAAFPVRRQALLAQLHEQQARVRDALRQSVLFEGFDGPTYAGWTIAGDAFGAGPSRCGDVVFGSRPDRPITSFASGGCAHSGLIAGQLEGSLVSRSFTLDKRFIHFRVAGRGGRVNLVIDGFPIPRDPIYGSLSIPVNDEQLAWRALDVAMWKGHRAYIEILDSTTPNLSAAPPAGTTPGQPGDGYVCVDEIRFSDAPSLPATPHPLNLQVLADPAVDSIAALAARYEELLAPVLARWQSLSRPLTPNPRPPTPDERDTVALLNWLLRNGLLDEPRRPAAASLAALLDRCHRIEASIPAPLRAPAMADGTSEDECVFLRGNYKTPGENAPRRFLEALAGAAQPAPARGSGRLELAQRLVAPSNPLTARVMVNRIWQHHFGEGIVRTPDDFGRMGQPPTHPELLDWLAAQFVHRGWSIKQMHRLMLLSSAYQMSSRDDARAVQRDPQNRLLHHMPVRRLEAEAVRDAILSVSGRLDDRMYGPGVRPYLTPFMQGRGRPRDSGPLDGAGRRSIYIDVRRNFLTPMFLAFDYPIPFTTRGRRGTSNVPAQALILMNSPFVVEQAATWAKHVLAQPGTPEQRITEMYLTAFARPPAPDELHSDLAFLADQGRRCGLAPEDARLWADLGHVLFNVKEFIFIE